ncbi:MAG: tRNA (adenosine(37)-N6)-dimethylallyltransferase MiaA [Chitinivibrionales bacterium]|nr:tRNA (adenosine(37)-N6)-dimethylallyltransferase MiaA [Chitinivibrionales bacterium]
MTVHRAGARIPVPVILGPTAVGKTELAVRVAADLDADIISCDSRQIYTGMDIGTAKPSPSQRNAVRHWLIDIVNPAEAFSAFDFAERTGVILRRLASQGRRGIICGGTNLYFARLSEGLGPQTPADPAFRQQLRQKVTTEGGKTIFAMLRAVDPETAARVHPHDIQRIIRALEVFHATAIPLSEHLKQTRPTGEFKFGVVVVSLPRSELYARIDKRVDAMVREGLWDEYRGLREAGYGEHSPGMNTLGYRELLDVDKGVCSFEQAIERIKRHTRRYAKKQMTWLRNKVAAAWEDMHADCFESVLHRFKLLMQ